ncbi:unnamed protein product, partial [Prorocentrum cordatum]
WRPPERSQNRELTHRFPPAARSQLGGRPSSSCIELGMAGAAKIAARARLAPHVLERRGRGGGGGGGRYLAIAAILWLPRRWRSRASLALRDPRP